MRFIHKWSYVCANYLMIQMKENHEKRRVYYFGFQVIIGSLVKGILLVALALLFRTLVPTLIIMLIFATLRVLAGGYHMETYGRCIVTSLALFLISGIIAQYTYESWPYILVYSMIIVSFIITLLAAAKYAPKDTPNKPITEPEEIKKFKRLSAVYVIIWFIVFTVLVTMGLNGITIFKPEYEKLLALSACFGLLLEIFTVTPFGYNFFKKISGELDKVKK